MRLNLVCALALALSGAAACGDDDATDGGGAADAGGGAADAGGGADASVACTTDMFNKYGQTAFLAVNDSIIEKSVAAPTSAVGTTFQDLAAEGADRVAEFTTNLANFLVQVYGGPKGYTGPTMEDAHEGLNITSEQYDYFIANVVVPALVDNGVPTTDIENCFAPPMVDPAFKNSIINR